jgi:hypothetical protein
MGRNARAAEPIHALRILAESVLTVAAAGTPVACPSNENAVAVRVCNNQTGKTAYAGLNATVDAVSAPPVGCAIPAGSHKEFFVRANSNELYVDAPTNADSVTIQILGY